MHKTSPVFVGFDRLAAQPQAVTLQPGTLLRHMMALGSSGSGKTVLCKAVVEEMVRCGLPAICIDPQGDLCSLALESDPGKLAQKGLDPILAKEFQAKADVVVFTPASRKGVALSADPVGGGIDELPMRERVYAVTGVASMIVSLLGYDLESDDGAGLVAVFDHALSGLAGKRRFPRNLEQFTDWLLKLDGPAKEEYARFLDLKKIDHACQKLARLDVGARRLLFHEGLALDIDLLLGRGANAAARPMRNRVSIIYLNTLSAQEDKEFFVAALCERLYAWMLKNPSDKPQALFYIDEVAPFIPPVRKPACKPSLALIFKQARKYGVCCLMATQNPADVDYKAMAQFGTWAIGRLTTRQDMAKVQPTVKSLDPVNVDKIMEELPAQTPGQFILISPDNFKNTHRLQTRWLLTRHETLNEDAIEQLAEERWRRDFDELEKALETTATSKAPSELVTPDPTVKVTPVEDEAEDIDEDEEEPEVPGEFDTNVISAVLRDYDNKLARKASCSAAEYAVLARLSEGQARSWLRKLASARLAGHYKQGRVLRYWSFSTGLRPDIGLDAKVTALTPLVTAQEAARSAEELRARKKLGIFGDDEHVHDVQLEHRLVLQLGFNEKVTRALWTKLTSFDFSATKELVDHVYLHPTNLKFLVYSREDGIHLEDKPADYASSVKDFDGVTQTQEVAPAVLKFNAQELADRKPDEVVKQAFKQRYNATAKTVRQVFLPVYMLHMATAGKSSSRVIMIDGLSGKPLAW